jgi:hypothetical protein
LNVHSASSIYDHLDNTITRYGCKQTVEKVEGPSQLSESHLTISRSEGLEWLLQSDRSNNHTTGKFFLSLVAKRDGEGQWYDNNV